MKKLHRGLLGIGLLLLTPLMCSAALTTYGFNQISFNGADPAIASQLKMQVYDSTQANADLGLSLGAGEVFFKFNNLGPLASSITGVYFDDGSLFALSNVFNNLTTGVDFSQGGSPGNLPSGNSINFNTSAGFLATSDPPTQPNGVNPLESVGISFTLQGGQTYADTIAALSLGLANPGQDVTGGLRVGLQVQATFPNGVSDAYVNGPPGGNPPPPPPPAVPEPGTMLLWSLGLAATCVTRRFLKA